MSNGAALTQAAHEIGAESETARVRPVGPAGSRIPAECHHMPHALPPIVLRNAHHLVAGRADAGSDGEPR